MKKYAFAFILATSFSGFAAGQEPSKVAAATEFVPLAGMSDLFEIESGKLAASKSANNEVKAAGQLLVADHRSPVRSWKHL